MDTITKIIKEYKEARGLLPIYVCVLGAPAVGKTLIISQLCQDYKLHHIKIADTIKEAIEEYVSFLSSSTNVQCDTVTINFGPWELHFF